MSSEVDVFENSKALFAPDFNPYSVTVLGLKIGDPESALAGWETEEISKIGTYHLQGGVAFCVKNSVIDKIKLPLSFFERLELFTIDEMLLRLGKNDDIREFGYRDRLLHRSYLWNKGINIWWEILPKIKPSNVQLFDPAHGIEQIGEAIYSLVEGENAASFKPPFQMPPLEEREKLNINDFVKLIFNIKIGSKSFNERMWVKVTEVQTEVYRGLLANDPYCTHEIRCGMKLQFHANHIIQIRRKNSSE